MTTKKSLLLSDEELEAFEATRDLYSELKQAAKDIQAGLGRVVYSPTIAARRNTGLTQAEFAELLGVSVHTLEEWEQAVDNQKALAALCWQSHSNILKRCSRQKPAMMKPR